MDEFAHNPVSEKTKARFWAKVDRRGEEECWSWMGSTKGRGMRSYGQISQDGKKRTATHISYEIATGKKFPKGLCACHKCDNPICVNPNHLFLGTKSENTKDGIEKGRILPSKMLVRNHNKEKTHCLRGHALSGENLYSPPSGQRICVTCRNVSVAKFKDKQRANARAALKGDE